MFENPSDDVYFKTSHKNSYVLSQSQYQNLPRTYKFTNVKFLFSIKTNHLVIFATKPALSKLEM